MFTKASVVAFFASIAAAQLHPPVGEPAGNPITRPLNEVSIERRSYCTLYGH